MFWIVTVNVVPLPSSLFTETSPPMSLARFWTIVRPRPVPPYLRVVEASAWVNAWKSLSICSCVIPIPESLTSIFINFLFERLLSFTSICICPLSQNFAAFEIKLRTICLVRVTSALIKLILGSTLKISLLLFCSTKVLDVSATSSSNAGREKFSLYSSTFPASILDKSKTSLIKLSKCLLAPWMRSNGSR